MCFLSTPIDSHGLLSERAPAMPGEKQIHATRWAEGAGATRTRWQTRLTPPVLGRRLTAPRDGGGGRGWGVEEARAQSRADIRAGYQGSGEGNRG